MMRIRSSVIRPSLIRHPDPGHLLWHADDTFHERRCGQELRVQGIWPHADQGRYELSAVQGPAAGADRVDVSWRSGIEARGRFPRGRQQRDMRVCGQRQ